VEGELVELEPIFVQRGDTLIRDDGFPPHFDRFVRAGFDVVELLGERDGVA
jgi:pilus assembly protein CpaF